MVLLGCLPGAEAFRIPVVHGLTEQLCAVLIGLVVAAAAIVTIDRSRVVVRIVLVVVVSVESCVLLTQAC